MIFFYKNCYICCRWGISSVGRAFAWHARGHRFDPGILHSFKSRLRVAFLFMYYTYILYSSSTDRYYVGSCDDLTIRIAQHNAGRNKSTKAGVPWIIQYTETFSTRSDARKRELEIKKKKSRKYIEWLINSSDSYRNG
jgi:putative endonuclease